LHAGLLGVVGIFSTGFPLNPNPPNPLMNNDKVLTKAKVFFPDESTSKLNKSN
jgi:hypothetical protein